MSESNQRVFITGLAALTACGNTLDETWQAIAKGQTGIGTISQWDIAAWPVHRGGELKNFQPARMLPDKKLTKVISRHDAMGIHVAVQAIEHSGMIAYRDSFAEATEFNDNTAIYVGSPGNKYFQQYDFLPLLAQSKGDLKHFAHELFNEVHPMWLLRILPNNVLAYTGITYGFKGPNHNIANHAAGGTQALLEGFHAIRSGQAERAVIVAYDTGIEPQAMFYYDQLGVLSQTDLRPFDEQQDGTVLGEGAAALILESEESVKARSAHCYAEMLGGLSATDGGSLFAVDEGDELAEIMAQTLTQIELNQSDIDLIVAHGNGNIKSDASEAYALQKVFPELPITAFKWATGHTLTASGLLDSVLAVQSLNEKQLPGIANLKNLKKQYQNLNIGAESRMLSSGQTAFLINRGFASMNACVVIKSCE